MLTIAARAHAPQKLGYPMYHAMTGNLPVLTPAFHHPPGMAADAAVGPSDYEYFSGNLPVISTEFIVTNEDEMQPGWVQLIDPITKKTVRGGPRRRRLATFPSPHPYYARC